MKKPYHCVLFTADDVMCRRTKDEPPRFHWFRHNHGIHFADIFSDGRVILIDEVVLLKGDLVEDPCPRCGQYGYRAYREGKPS